MPLPGSPAAGASTHSPRKRQARGERRIAQIVGATEELIADRGVQAVSMNAVARRAGISPGSLYQYFPGKDALVEEASRRIVARLQRATRKVSCAGTRSARPTAETAVDRLLEAAVSLAREHPALPALLAPTEQAGPNILLRTIARSLPSSGVVHNDGVTRDLATRIFCTGLGLAVQQPDPAVLLRATCRAVLSTLGATDDPQPSALPPAASQAGSSITAEG